MHRVTLPLAWARAALAPSLLFAISHSSLPAQVPADNPVRALFPASFDAATNPTGNPESYTWTDLLPWDKVTTTAAVAGDGQDDRAVVQAEIDALAASGGGVLYFPAGTYTFGDSLTLRSGVVLRGATPAQPDAREADFDPPTNFVFPRYVFDPVALTPADSRTARTAAFKRILLADATNARDVGLVNLDIERAVVEFINRSGVWGSSDKNLLTSRRLLILGNRINNASVPESGVPGTGQNAWQLWPDRRHGKIEVMAYENAMVANNRLNDHHHRRYVLGDTSAPVDDFRMRMTLPGGVDNATTRTQVYLQTGSTPLLPQSTLNGIVAGGYSDGTIPYGFADGYGIKINRSSAVGYTEHFGTGAVPQGATPVNEPSLFRRGLVLRRNWVYNPTRVAYHIAGDGLEARDNVKLDDPTKIAFIREDGTRWKTDSGTIECRGMDVTGTRLHLVDNRLTVHRYKLGWSYRPASNDFQYLSTDGEGILLQQAGGGTPVLDWRIEGNIMRGTGYIGIYKVPQVDGLVIRGNDVQVSAFDTPALFIWAYQDNFPGFVRGAIIENNIATNGGGGPAIQFRSPVRPFASVIRNNRVSPSIDVHDYFLDSVADNPFLAVSGNTLVDGTTPATVTRSEWIGSFPVENTLPVAPTITAFTLTPATYGPGDTVTVSAHVTVDPYFGVDVGTVRFYDGTRLTATSRGSEFAEDNPDNFVALTDPDGDEVFTGTWVVPANGAIALPVVEARLPVVSVFPTQKARGEGTSNAIVLRSWAIRPVAGAAPEPPLVAPLPASVVLGPTSLGLSVPSVVGARYRLERADSPNGTWTPIGDELPGNGQPLPFSADVPAGDTVEFLRVRVSRP